MTNCAAIDGDDDDDEGTVVEGVDMVDVGVIDVVFVEVSCKIWYKRDWLKDLRFG